MKSRSLDFASNIPMVFALVAALMGGGCESKDDEMDMRVHGVVFDAVTSEPIGGVTVALTYGEVFSVDSTTTIPIATVAASAMGEFEFHEVVVPGELYDTGGGSYQVLVQHSGSFLAGRSSQSFPMYDDSKSFLVFPNYNNEVAAALPPLGAFFLTYANGESLPPEFYVDIKIGYPDRPDLTSWRDSYFVGDPTEHAISVYAEIPMVLQWYSTSGGAPQGQAEFNVSRFGSEEYTLAF